MIKTWFTRQYNRVVTWIALKFLKALSFYPASGVVISWFNEQNSGLQNQVMRHMYELIATDYRVTKFQLPKEHLLAPIPLAIGADGQPTTSIDIIYVDSDNTHYMHDLRTRAMYGDEDAMAELIAEGAGDEGTLFPLSALAKELQVDQPPRIRALKNLHEAFQLAISPNETALMALTDEELEALPDSFLALYDSPDFAERIEAWKKSRNKA
jgi:hypothetical protein